MKLLTKILTIDGAKQVLDGVNLTVPKGSTTTVLGMSGCGKSTVMKHIIGLMKPDRGSIKVDGKDVPRLSYNELAEMRKQ